VYGVGAMNSIVTRMLLDKGVDVVGAIARSPAKVGRDLGEVIGLGRALGVTVSDDPAEVFTRTTPDIAVIAVNSYLTDAAEQLRLCADMASTRSRCLKRCCFPGRRHRYWPPSSTRQLKPLVSR
jgi:4-hydroxy-tetrahydrodipicolinate reductase